VGSNWGRKRQVVGAKRQKKQKKKTKKKKKKNIINTQTKALRASLAHLFFPSIWQRW
jgi:hypothetical protein